MNVLVAPGAHEKPSTFHGPLVVPRVDNVLTSMELLLVHTIIYSTLHRTSCLFLIMHACLATSQDDNMKQNNVYYILLFLSLACHHDS